MVYGFVLWGFYCAASFPTTCNRLDAGGDYPAGRGTVVGEVRENVPVRQQLLFRRETTAGLLCREGCLGRTIELLRSESNILLSVEIR